MCSKPPAVDLHPALALLIGTWKGEGKGEYPTTNSFAYSERIKFQYNGKPFLQYTQYSLSPENSPLHTESGYLKVVNNTLEFLVVDPVGTSQIYTGEITNEENETKLSLHSTSISLSQSAKDVKRVERVYIVSKDGNSLLTQLSMEAVEQPLSHHLSSKLTKQPAKTKQITPQEFTLDNYVALDVREAHEFETGHIPNAINVPLGALVSSFNKPGSVVYNILFPNEGEQKPVCVHCAHGFRGNVATQLLRKASPVVDVVNLIGGYHAWNNLQQSSNQ